MDDIKRQDLKVFLREFFSLTRMLVVLCLIVFIGAVLRLDHASGTAWARAILYWILVLIGAAAYAYSMSLNHRFINKRYRDLWQGCQDRLARFNVVLKKLKKDQIADLREMPATVERIAKALYIALRKADYISTEVLRTERDMFSSPPAWSADATDPQSKELYRIADKNIAEYRQQFSGVMAGVERAEAQSAVYMTTLDTLRMKMLGYRLVGKSPELSPQDFLEALAEAKLQLQAIDHALEELDLGQYPKQISVVPPPMPDKLRDNMTRPTLNTVDQAGLEKKAES